MSVAVLTDGKHPIVANVVAGFVKVSVSAPAGSHTFTVTAYDQPGALGDVLSTGTTAPVIVPAEGQVRVRLTLAGVVGRIVLALAHPDVTRGAPATIALSFTAQDADGNEILSGTPYAYPLTLTSSDPADARISQTAIAVDTTGITVAYDGANVRGITFSASGAGIASVTTATLIPLPPPAAGTQLVASNTYDTAGLAAFATLGANQLLTTFGLPPVPPSEYGEAAADSATGRLYIIDGVGTNQPRIDTFDTNGSGSYPVLSRFSLPFVPSSVAVDSTTHVLYVSEGPTNDIDVYDTGTGLALLGKITTGVPGVAAELAVDPKTKRLFLANGGPGIAGGIVAFSSVAPYGRVGTVSTASSSTMALDAAAGRLYVLPSGFGNYVSVFDTTSLKQIATLPVPIVGGDPRPMSVAVDAGGHRLFVLFGQVDVFGMPIESIVDVYATSGGSTYPFLGAFTVPGYDITTAPYRP